MLSKQEIGLHSAPLKRGVLKAQETKLTWANKNKEIIEFLTMGKQKLTVEVTPQNCQFKYMMLPLKMCVLQPV